MERVPEPELMDEPVQALAYARADFEEPNTLFVQLLEARFPGCTPRGVLDLGCGPADIPLRLAQRWPQAQVFAVDGAEAMLRLAHEAIRAAGLESRVHCVRWHLGREPMPEVLAGTSIDVCISNSLLHHLREPAALWEVLAKLPRGTAVAVMDLMRPPDMDRARAIVQTYAGEEPEVLRRDFLHSLCAAYRPGEVQQQLRRSGLDHLQVEVVSDRHLLVSGRR